MKKIITTLIGTSVLFASLGVQAEDVMAYAQESIKSTVKERQVTYVCPGKSLNVIYGFNKQGLPTFAEANLNGKNWIMPINLKRSDNMSTVFGDEYNYSLMSGYLSLNNYHKSSINVQNASSEILFKNCNAKSSKKLKG